MIWFYFIIVLLICPNTTIVAISSIANQLAAATYGNGGRNKSCFHKEKQALLDFKASLEDPLGQLSTWRPEDDYCCKWSGVICNNQTPHVTKLHLSSNHFTGLGGEISPSLLNLTYLHHLDLSMNSFNGTIPNFIGSMTRLTYLNLGSNSFNGTIPKSIGSLIELRYLDLSYSFLIGNIPPEIGNLTNLRNLSLGLGPYYAIGTMVENLDWLSNLSHLQHLDIDGVSLTKANHWVDVILSLPKLSYLSLSRCDLSEVMYPYSSFVNSSFSSIQYLDLSGNNLNSSMYRWLFSLTSSKLVSLDLSYNMLDGIPKYLGNLCSLTSLFLHANSAVVNFPDFLNNLSGCTSVALQELYASDNQFTGSLSDEIQKFSSLKRLRLPYNQLNGTISEKVWELHKLEYLDISYNSLRGVTSKNIGNSKLRYLDLSNNPLEVIPSQGQASKISYLEHIDLTDCKVGPLFPKWIQAHKNLTTLNIANTRISDTIPVEFWKTWPSRLTYLNLSSNNISGEVSDLSSNFGLYSEIDLSSNNLYGPIPNVPPTSISLDLSKNKFYGGIFFLCQIVDEFLSFLDLSHNSLTGQLPDCLSHFKGLEVLNLGHNNLSGNIPASIGYLVQLKVLHLYNNNLSGELPSALRNCTKLEYLNLGANNFFGNVPVWIGENLTNLYAISIRSNNFFGPIPLQLCHLQNLQILDLSVNNLNGTIPTCVNNLNVMVHGMSMPEQNKHWYTLAYHKIGGHDMFRSYVDNAMIKWQGNEQEFTNNLGLLTSIDLSSNNLKGQIPNELTDLHELLALDLSQNDLHGEIPTKVGEMKKLLTLDLSRNNFSGQIPSSMSRMTLLNYLDMSYNSLSGRIPSSTQLQSFEPSRYIGNAGLCGLPITKNCPGDEIVPPIVGESESAEERADEVERWFYIGGGIGFAIGFWIACGALLVNRRGRHAFFPLVDFLKDWVYIKVMVFIRKLQRV